MRLQFGFLALLAVLAGGCVVDGASEYDLASTMDDGAQEPVSDDRALGTASQALTHTGEVYWRQGLSPQGLGPTSDRFCFLTGIRGNFAGGSEVVKVYASDNSWWLSGSSGQTGVAAWAACAFTAPDNHSVEYSWPTDSSYPTNMGPSAGRVCVITRIGGAFNSNADFVHAYISDGQWFLWGDTNGTGVTVKARCISVTKYSPPKSWSGGAPEPEYMDYPLDTPAVCGMTKILGRLDSSTDMVHCDLINNAWYLTGTGAPGLGVYARTF